MGDYPLQQARAAIAKQLNDYQHIDHTDKGSWNNTPEQGPQPFVTWTGFNWHLFWGIHKHPWPLEFWYCFGTAIDSQGELTNPLIQFDIRELPKKYIGRFDIDNLKQSTCGREKHMTILSRAVADGFDFKAHAIEQDRLALEEANARQSTRANTHTETPDVVDDGVPF